MNMNSGSSFPLDAGLQNSLRRKSTKSEIRALVEIFLKSRENHTVSSHLIHKPHSFLTGHVGVITEVKDPGDGTVVWVTNILCHGDNKPLEIEIFIDDYVARIYKRDKFKDRQSDSSDKCEARVRLH